MWAVGVWGAFTASLLLLFRSHWAAPAFLLSLIGLALSTLYQFTANMPASLKSPELRVFIVLVWSELVFLLMYSRSMIRRGVLR